jgi:hypothetical protein
MDFLNPFRLTAGYYHALHHLLYSPELTDDHVLICHAIDKASLNEL